MLLYYNEDTLDKTRLECPSADWEKVISFNRLRQCAKKLTQGEGGNKRHGRSVTCRI